MTTQREIDYANFKQRLAKSLKDFAWITLNLIKITQKVGNKKIAFELNRVQRVVDWHVRDMEDNNLPVRLWILKGRQFGISTYFAIRAFIKSAILGENCLILAHKESPGRSMFKKVERAYNNLPSMSFKGQPVEIIPKPDSWLKETEMRWGGHLDSLLKRESAEVVDAGVSETYQHLHLTELPLWKDTSATMNGLLPTVAYEPGTSIVGEFTARGVGDYTHKMWVASEKGETTFRALFLAWYWHPEYARPVNEDDAPYSPEERAYLDWVGSVGHPYPLSEDGKDYIWDNETYGVRLTREQMMWRRDRITEFEDDIDMFKREFPATPLEAFQSSGRRVIPPRVMDKMQALTRKPIATGELELFKRKGSNKPYAKFIPRHHGRLHIFETPRIDATYMLDCDPSSGQGKDPTGIHVLKIGYQRAEVVASFRGKERPHDIARLLVRLARLYRCDMVMDVRGRRVGGQLPLVAVERNGFGEHVIHEMRQNLGYKRLYRHTAKNADNWTPGHRYGFPTTVETKLPMAQNLVQMCFEGTLICACARTVADLRALVYTNAAETQYEAQEGSTDDMAMSIGIGGQVASNLPQFRWHSNRFDDYDPALDEASSDVGDFAGVD